MLKIADLHETLTKQTLHSETLGGAYCLPLLAISVVSVSKLLYWLHSRKTKSRDGSDQETCLIIGGGLGGLAACVGLRKRDKTVKIVLVEPKDYFECIWASYRSIFDEYTADASLFDLDEICTKYDIKHVQDHVTKLLSNTALLSNGDTIKFDVAFVGVGAKTSCLALGLDPPLEQSKSEPGEKRYKGSMLARKEQMKAAGEKLIAAPSVVIVGGGIVGCELSGDLMDSKKKLKPRQQDTSSFPVTLIESGSFLCSHECNASASRMVYENLEKLGVRIILKEGVIQEKDGSLRLSRSGQVIKADEIVWSSGVSPANWFMDPALLNKHGWIPVDDCFRIQGSGGHIFAAGDCCTLLPNSGSQLLHQTDVFGRNLKTVLDALRKNKTKSSSQEIASLKLTPYSYMPEAYVITTGFNGGVAHLFGSISTRWVVPWIKNTTMFIFRPGMILGIKNKHSWWW